MAVVNTISASLTGFACSERAGTEQGDGAALYG